MFTVEINFNNKSICYAGSHYMKMVGYINERYEDAFAYIDDMGVSIICITEEAFDLLAIDLMR